MLIKLRKGSEPLLNNVKVITVHRYQMIEVVDKNYSRPFAEYPDGVVYDWFGRNL